MQAQDGECRFIDHSVDSIENQPWYGNNQYLYNILSNEGFYSTPNARYGSNCQKYLIPLKIWRYRSSSSDTNIKSISDIYDILEEVNQIYSNSNSGIQFYIDDQTTLNTSAAYSDIGSDFEMLQMFNTYKEFNVLNVHFVKYGIANGTAIWKYNYIQTIGTGSNLRSNTSIAKTLAHELGHNLGLRHTHAGGRGLQAYNASTSNCFQEAVNTTKKQENNCLGTIGKYKNEINGDALNDTAADPGLIANGGVVYLNGCSYNYMAGTDIDWLADNYASSWSPPISNIMSYGRDCRTSFSPLQVAVMWESLENASYLNDLKIPTLQVDYAGPLCLNIETDVNTNVSFDGVYAYGWSSSSNISVAQVNSSQNVIEGTTSLGNGYVDLDIHTNYGSFCLGAEVFVGVPIGGDISVYPYDYPDYQYNPVCENQEIHILAQYSNSEENDGLIEYEWSYNSSQLSITTNAGYGYNPGNPNYIDKSAAIVYILNWPYTNRIDAATRIKSSCGWSSYHQITFLRDNNCYYYFSVFPNPVKDELTVELNSKDDKDGLYRVKLIDKNSNERLDKWISKDKKTIDVRNVSKGNYILKIYYKDEVIDKQIVIE